MHVPSAPLSQPEALDSLDGPALAALWRAPLALLVIDGELRVQRANPHARSLLGVPLEELLGRPLGATLPALSGPASDALKNGRSVDSLELAGPPPLVATLQPMRGGLVAILQRAPSTSAEILRQLPAAVIVQPADGPLSGNERLKRMLGASGGGLLEAVRAVHRLDGSQYAFDELPAVRAARGEAVHGEEMVIVRADGGEVFARVSAVPVRDESGAVLAGAAVCEDVTVKKRLEEEQQKLLTLLESSADVIGLAATDGRPLYLNEPAYRLLGLKNRDEALAQPLHAFLTPGDARRARVEVLPRLLAGQRWDGEVELVHFGSGERIPVEVTAFRVGTSAVAVVGRDLRQRRRADDERARLLSELQAKQSLLDAVIDQLPAGVMVAEAGGRLLFSNEQAERILRRALVPVEAGAPARLSLDESAESGPLQRALREGATTEGEQLEVVRGDGTRALLRCNSAPLRDRDGQIFAAIAVFEDVTEEKAVERALLESEARFRRLAESGMIGVLFAGPERISDANGAFLELVGRTRDDLARGLTLQALTPAEHAPRDERALREARERGVCKPYSKDFLSSDGKRVPAVVGAARLEEGQGECVFFVLDDRERKRAEELQRQLMGIVSHDLRSPLSAVNMASALLLNCEDLPERHYKTVARIHSSSERMRGLINDLLDYQQARVGGGFPLTRRPCDLQTICAAVVAELEMVHADRELAYRPAGSCVGSWDAGRLSQVVQNLVGNALTHSPAGTRVELAFRADDATALLEVRNQGEPIPEEFLPHLFEPFRRFRTARDGMQGFGLGLFIVQEIVRAHGGTVEVASKAGQGTTFTVRLPRA